jgi:hypothetical protein
MPGKRTSATGSFYHVRAQFRAPIGFVFDWCTDFARDDAAREKDRYVRKIVSRSDHRVVFEDLVDSPKGWNWARHDVSLYPPNRWHSESIGSHRTTSLEYVLTRLGPERTRLDLSWRRWPTALGSRIPRAKLERAVTKSWKNFARALEKDYRKQGRRRR